jgi:hypothetical protein
MSTLTAGVSLAIVTGAIVFEQLAPLRPELAPESIKSVGYFPSAIFVLLSLFLTVKACVEVHEWIHYLIRRMYGKEPVFDNMGILTRGNPNVRIPGQWATRKENIAVLLAPLVSINVFLAAVIFVDIAQIVNSLAAVGIVINTGGAGSDILGAYDDLRFPEGTMIYYPEEGSPGGYIYEPKK